MTTQSQFQFSPSSSWNIRNKPDIQCSTWGQTSCWLLYVFSILLTAFYRPLFSADPLLAYFLLRFKEKKTISQHCQVNFTAKGNPRTNLYFQILAAVVYDSRNTQNENEEAEEKVKYLLSRFQFSKIFTRFCNYQLLFITTVKTEYSLKEVHLNHVLICAVLEKLWQYMLHIKTKGQMKLRPNIWMML